MADVTAPASSSFSFTTDVWSHVRGLYEREFEVIENIPTIAEHALSQVQRLLTFLSLQASIVVDFLHVI
jgi:hypothetical protein